MLNYNEIFEKAKELTSSTLKTVGDTAAVYGSQGYQAAAKYVPQALDAVKNNPGKTAAGVGGFIGLACSAPVSAPATLFAYPAYAALVAGGTAEGAKRVSNKFAKKAPVAIDLTQEEAPARGRSPEKESAEQRKLDKRDESPKREEAAPKAARKGRGRKPAAPKAALLDVTGIEQPPVANSTPAPARRSRTRTNPYSPK